MAACSACHQVWPETMMVRIDNHWVCQLCKERALDSKERFQMNSTLDADRLRTWGIILTVVAVLGFTGFRMFMRSAVRTGTASVPDIAEAEPWVKGDVAKWPAILLPNELKVDGVLWRPARQGFLLQRKDLSIFGATVVSKVASDTNTPQPFAFSEWKLGGGSFPQLVLGKIPPTAETALEHGVLVAPVTAPGELPVTPLKLRLDGYAQNMRMKIIVSAGPGGAARVHPVTVRNNASSDDSRIITVERNLVSGHERVVGLSGDGSGTLLELGDPAPIDELVGAPVIDAFGHVAAIVTGPENGVARNGVARRVKAFGMDALRRAVEP